jgi:SAM-dependent methyltransferase
VKQYNEQHPPSRLSTQRFTDRVADYVRFRPGYPEAVVETVEGVTGLSGGATIADIGSGTGISTGLFLRHGYTVYAVEPNDAMRGAAERHFAGEPGFRSVNGTAEATTLPETSVDVVTAAQAFHWFRPYEARREFLRILRPPRWVAIVWNDRLTDTPFLADYDRLLLEYSIDYAQVDHRNIDVDRLRDFFRGDFHSRSIPNEQVLDHEGLRGRLLSSSYAPAAGHPRHEPMIAALHLLFDAHQEHGQVRFHYSTKIFVGTLTD